MTRGDPVTAGVLRRAADSIRAEWRPVRGSAWGTVQNFHLAAAEWLDAVAETAPPDPHHGTDRCETCDNVARALTVARAYLGELSKDKS